MPDAHHFICDCKVTPKRQDVGATTQLKHHIDQSFVAVTCCYSCVWYWAKQFLFKSHLYFSSLAVQAFTVKLAAFPDFEKKHIKADLQYFWRMWYANDPFISVNVSASLINWLVGTHIVRQPTGEPVERKGSNASNLPNVTVNQIRGIRNYCQTY